MNLTKLTLEELFLLQAFVREALEKEKNVYLTDKLDKLQQEVLNRIDKI
jgi:hypothetical protein